MSNFAMTKPCNYISTNSLQYVYRFMYVYTICIKVDNHIYTTVTEQSYV